MKETKGIYGQCDKCRRERLLHKMKILNGYETKWLCKGCIINSGNLIGVVI